MNAYDYDKQEWVDGDEARRVRAAQIRDELALLKGPRGLEYLRFCGSELRVEDAIERLEMELVGL